MNKTLLIIIATIFVLIYGTYRLSVSALTENCKNFATESGRETKMSYLGYGNWNCLTQNKEGKWISVTLLRSLD